MSGSKKAPIKPSRKTSPISFDVIVDRMELVRHSGDGEGDSLKWNVYLYDLGAGHQASGPNFVMVGHLFRSSDKGHGQVRATAFLRAYERDQEPMSTAYVTEELAYGFVEPIYDACRRALQSQSAIMDVDLDLPFTSPITEVRYEELPELSTVKK
ncbi:hypothetical protein [Pseudarthrobacter sp. BRE9]|uniref:hypothetical protein n=1 Tax=Pseudarthrobacter sp. BRE9 TaxID=2962582 RepID=UPI0028810453|nr:hypothetical protein [Pseudarthrobacter sp. BRE9]MDT0169565.1 hypothetical protein [Pseudarthrobacter sp. BRE9]